MSPTDFIAHTNALNNRGPASEPANKAYTKNAVTKKLVTSKEMQDLKAKLALLEIDLKAKQDQLDQKSKEIEQLKINKSDEKIEALSKLIIDQKADIDKLKIDIKNSEVKDFKIVNNNKVEVVICKSESKGEKLQDEVKKGLEDKEAVIKKVEDIKLTEIKKEEIKPIAKTEEEKKEVIAKAEDKTEDKKADAKPSKEFKSDNSEMISLMSQMTTMFTTQMQAQMQLQVQMMTMLSQMQTNFMPQMSPYAYDFSSQAHPYSYNDTLGLGAWNVGIPATSSHWPTQSWSNNYSSPYSVMPSLERQPAQAPTDFGFSFKQQQYPMMPFDFNQAPAPTSPAPVQKAAPVELARTQILSA